MICLLQHPKAITSDKQIPVSAREAYPTLRQLWRNGIGWEIVPLCHTYKEERTRLTMNDSYTEWLVKRKAPASTMILKAALIALCAVSAFLALTTIFGIIILTAAGAATYFIFQNLDLEFEYLIVNDQISVDKIMGKARRKKVWEGTLGEMQIVAPLDSYILKDYEKPDMKRLDFGSHTQGAKVYGMVFQGDGGQVTKIIFEPNDKILQHIRQRAPRKVVM